MNNKIFLKSYSKSCTIGDLGVTSHILFGNDMVRLINITKNKLYPVVWHNKKDIEQENFNNPIFITYGWEKLCNKLIEQGISKSSFKQDDIYRWFCRTKRVNVNTYPYIINGYVFVSGYNYLLTSLGKIILNHNCEFFMDRDINADNLFFTAPKKWRENIISGQCLIRTNKHYIQTSEKQKKDETEGSNSMSTFDTETGMTGSINEKSFDAFYYCLHDNKITPEAKKKFGDDTYKITDLNNWITEMYNQFDKYWSGKDMDYIGSIVYFGKVIYNNVKDINSITSDRVLRNELNDVVSPSLKINFKNVTINKYQKTESFFDTLKKDHLTKRVDYKEESEYRLILIPMFLNLKSYGFLLNKSEYIINTDLEIKTEKGSITQLELIK